MKILKYHPHNSVLFVTFSLEQGLLLLSNPLCLAIIKSCLARAQFKHPVTISAFLVEATHVHLILVVNNPEDVPGFIGYFKRESAHMFNRVLGRKKRTVWCEGYDSPVVLTPIRTLIALSYIYSNPAKDNLEDSIDKYPGLSSWKMFVSGDHVKNWKRLRRPAFNALPPDAHSLRGYSKEADRILADSKKTHQFRLDPNAWLKAHKITDPDEQAAANSTLLARIRTLEKRAAAKRQKAGKKVIGCETLLSQCLNTTYLPNRSGKRMCCLSEERQLRIDFINFLKDLYAKAKEIAARWKLGDFSNPFPLGLYPPSMPKLAEPIGIS